MNTLAAETGWSTTAFVLGWFALISLVLVSVIFAVSRILAARTSARREEGYREQLDRATSAHEAAAKELSEVKTRLAAIEKAMTSFD
ncbi:hypothetical protein [Streptomyces xanthophaeus]|uniref:hypothetical protein n=1 Tax=Streptomyces xanthophaeus TaxID=67385 RepID=UPI0026489338|nr:hypothetical protein [Streptomyces xanthophaeus]WKD32130.1 hypothetical protein KO717_09325 [Streptomyces xanthophaeus]